MVCLLRYGLFVICCVLVFWSVVWWFKRCLIVLCYVFLLFGLLLGVFVWCIRFVLFVCLICFLCLLLFVIVVYVCFAVRVCFAVVLAVGAVWVCLVGFIALCFATLLGCCALRLSWRWCLLFSLFCGGFARRWCGVCSLFCLCCLLFGFCF